MLAGTRLPMGQMIIFRKEESDKQPYQVSQKANCSALTVGKAANCMSINLDKNMVD